MRGGDLAIRQARDTFAARSLGGVPEVVFFFTVRVDRVQGYNCCARVGRDPFQCFGN